MKDIILTGSSVDFPNWWKENIHKLHDYEVHSINTSLVITKDLCKCWYKSSDFFGLHSDLKDTLGKYENVLEIPTPHYPFSYWGNNTSGTMILNALRNIANNAFWDGNVSTINIIGCDLIYKENQNNHFYSGGTPDPMRLGVECLSKNLFMFKRLSEMMGISIYNLSTNEETLLPFDKRVL